MENLDFRGGDRSSIYDSLNLQEIKSDLGSESLQSEDLEISDSTSKKRKRFESQRVNHSPREIIGKMYHLITTRGDGDDVIQEVADQFKEQLNQLKVCLNEPPIRKQKIRYVAVDNDSKNEIKDVEEIWSACASLIKECESLMIIPETVAGKIQKCLEPSLKTGCFEEEFKVDEDSNQICSFMSNDDLDLFGGSFEIQWIRCGDAVTELMDGPVTTHLILNQEMRQQNINERLERNRGYARTQQEMESPQQFVIKDDKIPDEVCNKPLVTEAKMINRREIGIAFCQGIRPAMEDSHLASQVKFYVNGQEYVADVFGVFDGHGGAKCSAFVEAYLTAYLKEALEVNNTLTLTDVGIWDALKACFKKLDADYQGEDGTTATVALLLENKVWVANTGDSRTILVKKNGATVQASEDAKPSEERHRKKIEHLGGFVEMGRACGELAVARAIGDKEYVDGRGVCCISPNPKITNYSIDDFIEGYLVLACDGLYEVATSDEVGQAIHQMSSEKRSMENMSKHLVASAIIQDSWDNVSVMVIGL